MIIATIENPIILHLGMVLIILNTSGKKQITLSGVFMVILILFPYSYLQGYLMIILTCSSGESDDLKFSP
jgi:hypothetical protein